MRLVASRLNSAFFDGYGAGVAGHLSARIPKLFQ
jgi:hypothetical protein